MRTIQAIIALVLVVLCAGCAKPPLTQYVVDDGTWAILLPGTPKRSVTPVQTAIGPIDMIQYSSGGGNSYTALAYADYPSFIANAPALSLLEGARDGALKNTNAKLVEDKERHLGEFLGKEIKADLPVAGYGMRAFIFLVKRRLYQIIIVGTKDEISSARADSIFFSFELRRDPQ
ncbi:MAG TPA: hypothetical protein VMF29_03975 [Candidatus Edwardsbacteria bacterium]|nr:hypothetical protein [Candidatus Edwardsbacteria bacterium]